MSRHTQHIRKARRDYLNAKRGTLKASTIRCYSQTTEDFIEYLEESGIEATENIDGYVVQQWKLKRKEHDDVSPITLQNDVRHLRVFIKWLEASELVATGLYDKIEVPSVTDDQARDDTELSATRAQQVLSHLEQYEYATRTHALIQVLWHTGCRISAASALDLRDYAPDERVLRFRNRRDTGTPLKNGDKSERNVTINQQTIDVLNDYINARRSPVTDDYDREPLLSTSHGRVSQNRAYKDLVAISRPCVYTNDCPHGKDQPTCEAKQKKKRAADCPSSRSAHPIRRGSITYHLNSGMDLEDVSERCDVGRQTLEKHYDTRTHEDKRQQRMNDVDKL